MKTPTPAPSAAIATTSGTAVTPATSPPPSRRPLLMFLVAVGVVTLAFLPGWLGMARAAGGDDLHAYAAMIPFISAWIAWQYARPTGGPAPTRARWAAAVPLALLALGAGALSYQGRRAGWVQLEPSWLASQMVGWVLAVWAAALAVFGIDGARRALFPLGFLVFTIPLPDPAVQLIERALQHASADAVAVAFNLLDVTFSRDERSFWLPGLRFEVAQECSGVRSTVVLFITSIIGGYLLLRSPWRRAVLALSIIPLGIARNTFRICTITLLSVHVDPRIIDSPLHHRGGPLFFGVSLIPFFILLWWLRRQEQRRLTQGPPASKT